MESQIEAAESRRAQSAKARLTAEQVTREREIESLQLSKIRVLRDLEAATSVRYRESLEAALHHLEAKIASFDAPAGPVK